MKIVFIGTGTSQGVPVIACPCLVCASPDPKDKRFRTSVWIETPHTSLVVDTGPDFRTQMLGARVNKLDAILLTHSHKDHIAGLDDVRAYNYFQKNAMPVYASPATIKALEREFYYIFNGDNYPGIPQIDVCPIDPNQSFQVGELTVQPVAVKHYHMDVLAFRIGDFSYVTDANYIAPEEMDKLRGSKVLVLNALRKESHISHFNLSEAIEVAREIGAEATYLTHISHQMGLHEEVQASLPEGIFLAYDGLELNVG